MKQTEKNKEKAIKISQKKFWREFDLDDIKFLNEVKKYNLNQNTHYPINNVEIKDNQELNQILENIIKNSNVEISTKQEMICQEYKRSIVLATLYLFLVYKEMIKINIEDFELYFSHKPKRSIKQCVN